MNDRDQPYDVSETADHDPTATLDTSSVEPVHETVTAAAGPMQSGLSRKAPLHPSNTAITQQQQQPHGSSQTVRKRAAEAAATDGSTEIAATSSPTHKKRPGRPPSKAHKPYTIKVVLATVSKELKHAVETVSLESEPQEDFLAQYLMVDESTEAEGGAVTMDEAAGDEDLDVVQGQDEQVHAQQAEDSMATSEFHLALVIGTLNATSNWYARALSAWQYASPACNGNASDSWIALCICTALTMRQVQPLPLRVR